MMKAATPFWEFLLFPKIVCRRNSPFGDIICGQITLKPRVVEQFQFGL
jgi:hypothetical protein